jgi:hypothetical protein
MKKSRLLGVTSGCVLSLVFSNAANSALIDVYFGANLLNTTGGALEAQLMDITYTGESGGEFVTTMPAFSGFTCSSDAVSGPCTGLPDLGGPLVNDPTYTTGGDGETTRTIGQTVPIYWDTSGAFPTITITSITAIATGGVWEADVSGGGYTLGLISGGSGSNELSSSLASPQGDIYNNSVATVISTSAPIGFESFIGNAFGEFVFSAASPVPVPAAVWLFGSGLLGLVGIARRKKA